MRRTFSVVVLSSILWIAAADRIGAASTPEASEWLEKMVATFEGKPFRVGYTADLSVSQMGQGVSIKMEGSTTYADASHVRSEGTMSTDMGGVKMEMKMLTVADGELLWAVMENPMMGKQVMKMPVDMANDAAAMGGMGGSVTADPVSQMRELERRYDFDVASKQDGTVTLKGAMNEKALAEMGAAREMAEAMKDIELVLDAETGFPTEMRVGRPPLMDARFAKPELLDTAKLDMSLFEYTPPADVQVIDLEQMRKMAGP